MRYGTQTRQDLANACGHGIGDAERRRGLQHVRAHVPRDRQVHGTAGVDGGLPAIGQPERVLGRRRRRRREVAIAIGHQQVERELRGALHQRVRRLPEPGRIATEGVVLPEVLRQPRAAHRPRRPDRVAFAEAADRRGLPPQVRVVMRRPAAGAVVDARGRRTRGGEFADHLQQRLVTFGQVGGLGRPVVHLGVDVDRVVAAPGGAHLVVPQSLQVGRLRPRTAAGDEEIPAVLEQQRRERRIVSRAVGEAHVERPGRTPRASRRRGRS